MITGLLLLGCAILPNPAPSSDGRWHSREWLAKTPLEFLSVLNDSSENHENDGDGDGMMIDLLQAVTNRTTYETEQMTGTEWTLVAYIAARLSTASLPKFASSKKHRL